MTSGEITIRVRYAETDRMGLLHHAQYLVYFEAARVELLRTQGYSYRDIEDQGFYLVLTKLEVRYKKPVYFDDVVVVRVIVERTTSVRIDHRYEVMRDGTLVAEGASTLGGVDGDGNPQALPETLRK